MVRRNNIYMTEVCLPMQISSMDHRRSTYSSDVPYIDNNNNNNNNNNNYISPGPSIYPQAYELSPPPSSTYQSIGGIHSRSSEDWVRQDVTLVSHSEREMAKDRRREQNRASQRAYRKRKGGSSTKSSLCYSLITSRGQCQGAL